MLQSLYRTMPTLLRSSQFMSQPRFDVFAEGTPPGLPRRRQPSSVSLRIFAVCLTSVVVAVHYTNFGPLIPVMRDSLHITNSQAGLLSTFLFLGLAVTYIPAGALIDQYGPRPVLIGSSILLVLGGALLPLFPNITWILLCRTLVGEEWKQY